MEQLNKPPELFIPVTEKTSSSRGLWIIYLIVYLIAVFIVYIIAQIILYKYNIKENTSVINNWWNHNNGSKYNKCFNISLIKINDTTTWIGDIISKDKTKEISNINSDMINFLINYILWHIFVQSDKGNKNFGKPKQFLFPRHLCQSILFEKGEDYYYDKYLNSGNSPKWPNDAKDWRNRTAKWCGPDSGVKWTQGANNTKNLYGISLSDTAKSEWFKTNSDGSLLHPDNIFARYSINYDSPLVYSLCNGNYTATASGISLEYSACMALMGYTETGQPLQTEGGWIGFLKNFKSSNSLPQDFLYTRLTLANKIDDNGTGSIPCSPGKKSGAFQGAIVQGGMLGMMAGPMLLGALTALTPLTGGASLLVAGALTVGVAGGVGLMDYNSKMDGSNCK